MRRVLEDLHVQNLLWVGKRHFYQWVTLNVSLGGAGSWFDKNIIFQMVSLACLSVSAGWLFYVDPVSP